MRAHGGNSMAHRNGGRDAVLCPGTVNEGFGEEERDRSTRRGRSVTPRMALLWDENRRLYMDNLRLWDCLTLVRGDPSMTCQNAIKLVFGLSDDEYLRMFPGECHVNTLCLIGNTKQLMVLMFPSGIVYHTSSENARVENARLKDENARLHAAVWVLRDNPSLQADSTVAAIFRLNEAQFLSKFHTDISNYNIGSTGTFNKPQYQNNNKEQRKSFQTFLDSGNEPAMAIHLTNKPLKGNCYRNDKLSCSRVNRRQRSHSLVPPKRLHRQNSASSMHHYDFTSNWKPTTPPENESVASKMITNVENHLNSDWAVLCWRQSHFLQPVDLHALERAKPQDCDGHCMQSKNRWQVNETTGKCSKHREFRRSNSVSRGGDILAERISKRASPLVPLKCVSFAEPLPSCLVGSPIPTELSCLGDKVNLGAKYNHSYCSQVKTEDNEPVQAVAEGINDLFKKYDCSIKCMKPEGASGIYTVAATREPSKKCQKDTVISPVLDTRTCFLILGQSQKPIPQEQNEIPESNCTISDNDNYMFDNNNNNDNNTATTSLARLKPGICNTSAQSKTVRPLSPKHRNIRQTRMKNMLSCEKVNKNIKLKCNHDSNITCSTNNASNLKKRGVLLPSVSVGEDILSINNLSEEPTMSNKENITENESDDEMDLIKYITHSLNPINTKKDTKPTIYFSDEPAPQKLKRNAPYNFRSYTTVKDFLDRHHCILSGRKWCHSQQKVPTEEINSSVTQLTESKPSNTKQEVTASSIDKMELSVPSILIDCYSDSKQQDLVQKHKDKRVKPAVDHFDVPSATNVSNLQSNYRKLGKPKVFDMSIVYSKKEKLEELKKLGNFKYSKPLTVMLKRNGSYDCRTTYDDAKLSVNILPSIKTTPLPQKTMNSYIKGPYITFTPKQ